MLTKTPTYFVACVLALAFFAAELKAQTTAEAFDRQVQEILDHWAAPGAAIAIVKGGEPLLIRGYGSTRVSGGQQVTATTLTSVGSVTKTVNSIALGILVAEGKIAWDDPVRRYLPQFEFGDAYRSDHTTIRDLITHRAGLPNIMGGLWSMSYTIEDLFKQLPAATPTIAFRERVQYSQVGIALLGDVVRAASGTSWPNFVQQKVLDPLQMRLSYPGTEAFLRAYPDSNVDPRLMGRAVRMGNVVSDGPWKGVGRIYTPAGGLVTTAEDMTKFLRFLLRPEGGELSGITRATLEELFTPQEVDRSPYQSLVSPLSGLVTYCLGWIAHEYQGEVILEHPGSNFGSSVLAIMPSQEIGVFVSSNANYSFDSDRMVSALKFAAIDHALGQPTRDWIALMSGP
jgi:CubicO group peptidase (beta-lactamase class C family)